MRIPTARSFVPQSKSSSAPLGPDPAAQCGVAPIVQPGLKLSVVCPVYPRAIMPFAPTSIRPPANARTNASRVSPTGTASSCCSPSWLLAVSSILCPTYSYSPRPCSPRRQLVQRAQHIEDGARRLHCNLRRNRYATDRRAQQSRIGLRKHRLHRSITVKLMAHAHGQKLHVARAQIEGRSAVGIELACGLCVCRSAHGHAHIRCSERLLQHQLFGVGALERRRRLCCGRPLERDSSGSWLKNACPMLNDTEGSQWIAPAPDSRVPGVQVTVALGARNVLHKSNECAGFIRSAFFSSIVSGRSPA